MTSYLVITPIKELYNRINYFIKSFKNFSLIYVSLNKSQESIEYLFKKNGINTDRLFLIDCVASEKTRDDALHIDPTRLDLLNPAINEFIEDIEGKKFLIIDSLSTLLIYNDESKVAKFVKEIIEYSSKNDVMLIAFSPKTEEEELLIKIFHFFDKVIEK